MMGFTILCYLACAETKCKVKEKHVTSLGFISYHRKEQKTSPGLFLGEQVASFYSKMGVGC